MRKRRKNHKRMVGNMSILYISSILALSFMGVGYAAWNDGLNLDMAITTGNTESLFAAINISNKDLDDGEWISLTLSNDKKTLYIDGEVYPTFNGNIPIKILDNGSIPVILKNIDYDNGADITKLKEEGKNKYSRRSFVKEDVVETFDLNINPDNVNDAKNGNKDNIRKQIYSLENQDEISNLQEQIDQYNTEEEYDFEYELLLEQAL